VKGAVRISPCNSVDSLRYPVVSRLELWTWPASPQGYSVRLEHFALPK
jgi:hypothetical protein